MHLEPHTSRLDRSERSAAILDYWFADLDDASPLDRSGEPFRTCYGRWYGKQPEIDREIRASFEQDLRDVTAPGVDWAREIEAWRRAPNGLLALVILLDQLPRNMYRGTAGMYAHDAIALSVATLAIREHEGRRLPLVRRLFLYLPSMHAEQRSVQRKMVEHIEQLAQLAEHTSPANLPFFANALGYARRHAEVIESFGRFPHRNAILGRTSTPEEEEYLRRPDAGF